MTCINLVSASRLHTKLIFSPMHTQTIESLGQCNSAYSGGFFYACFDFATHRVAFVNKSMPCDDAFFAMVKNLYDNTLHYHSGEADPTVFHAQTSCTADPTQLYFHCATCQAWKTTATPSKSLCGTCGTQHFCSKRTCKVYVDNGVRNGKATCSLCKNFVITAKDYACTACGKLIPAHTHAKKQCIRYTKKDYDGTLGDAYFTQFKCVQCHSLA